MSTVSRLAGYISALESLNSKPTLNGPPCLEGSLSSASAFMNLDKLDDSDSCAGKSWVLHAGQRWGNDEAEISFIEMEDPQLRHRIRTA